MQLRAQILAIGILLSGIPALTQDNGPETAQSKAEYREKLKALSDEAQNARPNDSSNEARQIYKEKLKRLSGSDDAAKASSQKGPSGVVVRSKEADSEADRLAIKPKVEIAVKPVALSQPVPGHVASSDDHQAAVQAPVGECDAYCQQLRRTAEAQDPSRHNVQAQDERNLTTERNFIKNLAFDQMHIWASPFKLRDGDSSWAIPFGIVTGSLIATDRDVSKQAATPSRLARSRQISDAGLYSFIGAGAGFYGVGLLTHDDHKRETGLLSGEAFVNATLVAEALKLAVGRQRPFEGDHFGHIGRGGSSFPSGHAIDSFAIATVIAHEYPNPFVRIGAYGLAATVAATRVTAGQHFPSDVLVGSAFGYLIGRKIYNDHHNPELSGAEYGVFVRSERGPTKSMGSPYVPLDSWVYPAIEKLVALGYVRSAFLDMRPWSRTECARVVQEATESSLNAGVAPSNTSWLLLGSLKEEFKREIDSSAGETANRSGRIESVYERVLDIAGPPLNDSFHFGQTIINDYGRPYQRGFNTETGFSGFASSGPLMMYFRGEYQSSPFAPGYPLGVRQAIASIDAFPGNPPLPVLPEKPFSAVGRSRILEAYAAVNIGGYQLSFGKQSLWWGPGDGSAMLLSNNAEPIPMVRLTNVKPIRLPGIAGLLGPVRLETFFGRLEGHNFVAVGDQFDQIVSGANLGNLADQPFFNGQKFSFMPTPNFEFSVSRTGIIGGIGDPLTLKNLGESFIQLNSGSGNHVGSRQSGVDLTYRIPGLRNRLLFYVDAHTRDEVSPLDYPRRAPMMAGIYVPKVPKIAKLDFRAEGGYTDIPDQNLQGFFYWNRHYLSGFTNDGNIVGSWIGRDGRGIQMWSTYWFSSRSKIQFDYRYQGLNDSYLKGGGLLNDVGIRAVENIARSFDFSQSLQFEHWNYPVLSTASQNNVSTTLQITYWPSWGTKHRGE